MAVDRLLEKGLVSRVESPDDRRVRIVALTKDGKDLIVPIFRKHSAEIGRVFADANPKELQILEKVLKKAGKRARALAEERREKQDQESLNHFSHQFKTISQSGCYSLNNRQSVLYRFPPTVAGRQGV